MTKFKKQISQKCFFLNEILFCSSTRLHCIILFCYHDFFGSTMFSLDFFSWFLSFSRSYCTLSSFQKNNSFCQPTVLNNIYFYHWNSHFAHKFDDCEERKAHHRSKGYWIEFSGEHGLVFPTFYQYIRKVAKWQLHRCICYLLAWVSVCFLNLFFWN